MLGGERSRGGRRKKVGSRRRREEEVGMWDEKEEVTGEAGKRRSGEMEGGWRSKHGGEKRSYRGQGQRRDEEGDGWKARKGEGRRWEKVGGQDLHAARLRGKAGGESSSSKVPD